MLEVGIDTQYLFATLNDVRRVEGKREYFEPANGMISNVGRSGLTLTSL